MSATRRGPKVERESFVELVLRLLEKVRGWHVAAVLLVAGAALATPIAYLRRMDIPSEVIRYRGLGILLWVMFASFITLSWLFGIFGKRIARATEQRLKKAEADQIEAAQRAKREALANELTGRLHRLTRDEQGVLRPYIEERIRSRPLDFTNGAVGALEIAGVIYKATPTSVDWRRWSYAINELPYHYLTEHPELLTRDDPTPRSPR